MCFSSKLISAMTVYLFFLITLLIPPISTEIVDFPESVVVFINSEAIFTCDTRDAPAVSWQVNGTFFNQLDASLRADVDTDQKTVGENEQFALTIPARAKYNGTVVECIVSQPGGAFIKSKNATLVIQGLLAVSNVSVENGSDSIRLSWSPPFSLDVTGVDPDIWYTVLISNVTDEDNPTAVPCTDCHNLTQPHYTFTTANPSPCHKYSFRVVVILRNSGSVGNMSEPVKGAFVSYTTGFNVSEAEPVLTYLSNDSFSVALILHIIGSEEICSYQYTVYVESEDDLITPQGTTYRSYTTEPLQLLGGNTLEFNVSNLTYDSKYLVTIEGKSQDSQKYNASLPFQLSTFYVQSADATTADGRLIVKGTFITNSPDQGYLLVITSNSSSPDQMMAVLNTSAPAEVTGLEPNIYDILVYDVEENGLPNENLAVRIENRIVSQGYSGLPPKKDSMVLESVTIRSDDDHVNITCHFKSDGSSSQQCIIVIRNSNDSVLMVEYYPRSTKFPVKLPLSKSGDYSVAAFGWSDEMIEPFPEEQKLVHITQGMDATPRPTPPQDLSLTSSSDENIIGWAIGGAIIAAIIAAAIIVIIVVIVVVIRKKRKKKEDLTSTNHELHVTTSSHLTTESENNGSTMPSSAQGSGGVLRPDGEEAIDAIPPIEDLSKFKLKIKEDLQHILHQIRDRMAKMAKLNAGEGDADLKEWARSLQELISDTKS